MIKIFSPPIVRAKFLSDQCARPTEGKELDALKASFREDKRKKLVARRRFIAAATALGVSPWLLRRRVLAAANATIPSFTVAPGTAAWPGQAGNLVGFANSPGYPGSLTSGGTVVSNTTYSFLNFTGSGTTNSSKDFSGLTNTTMIGCRFQANNLQNNNTSINTCSGFTLSYCSFVPLVSFYTSPPTTGTGWPSSYAGIPVSSGWPGFITNTNCIDGTKGYEYGIVIGRNNTGLITVDHCDLWGYGNAITLDTSTNQINITNNWIHDSANSSPEGYHNDGVGYLNGGGAPQNVTITGNTIASLGNTNGVAMQQGTGYHNIIVSSNYISGFGYSAAIMAPSATATNCTAHSNVFSTAIQIYAPEYPNAALWTGTSNSWRLNTLLVYPGSVPRSDSTFSWVSGNNGQFIFPNNTISPTDFTG